MKKQKKLGTYLTVTAGVGCSAANASVVIIDISAFDGPNGGVAAGTSRVFLDIGGLDGADLDLVNAANFLGLEGEENLFLGTTGGKATPRVVGPDVSIDGSNTYSTLFDEALFLYDGTYGANTADATVGDSFIPFRINGGADENTLGFFQVTWNGTDTFEILGAAYESEPGVAITTFDVSSIPEPSGLSLLALGSAGLAARRRRKQAA